MKTNIIFTPKPNDIITYTDMQGQRVNKARRHKNKVMRKLDITGKQYRKLCKKERALERRET